MYLICIFYSPTWIHRVHSPRFLFNLVLLELLNFHFLDFFLFFALSTSLHLNIFYLSTLLWPCFLQGLYLISPISISDLPLAPAKITFYWPFRTPASWAGHSLSLASLISSLIFFFNYFLFPHLITHTSLSTLLHFFFPSRWRYSEILCAN